MTELAGEDTTELGPEGMGAGFELDETTVLDGREASELERTVETSELDGTG